MRWQNTQRYLKAAKHRAQIGLIQKEHRNHTERNKEEKKNNAQRMRRMKETHFSKQHISKRRLKLNE